MNKNLIAFLSLLFIWITFPAFAEDIQSYSELQYAPPAEDNGELVVDFQNDESESFISSMLGKLGLTQSDYSFVSKEEKWVRVRKTATYLLGLLKEKEGVESVEPNYYYSALYVPNDPYYKHQWHLDLIGMQKEIGRAHV